VAHHPLDRSLPSLQRLPGRLHSPQSVANCTPLLHQRQAIRPGFLRSSRWNGRVGCLR
jgi:hypothetical protein